MNKQEFIDQLRMALSGLPQNDIDERLTFYSEIIDDRLEDGIPEETAIREIGNVDELISQIKADIPLGKLIKEKVAPNKKLKALEIVFLILGSPVWLSLLITAFAVILSFYAVLCSGIIVLWAAFTFFAACSLAGITSGIYWAINGYGLTGAAMAGAGIVSAGLSVFMFFGSQAATKGIVNFTKKLAIRIKNCFINKEER